MLKNLYFFIIIIPIVQIECATVIRQNNKVRVNVPTAKRSFHKVAIATTREPQLEVPRHYEKSDPRFFDSVVEHSSPLQPHSSTKTTRYGSGPSTKKSFGGLAAESKSSDRSYDEIKALLAKVLEQIEQIERKSDGGGGGGGGGPPTIASTDKEKVHFGKLPGLVEFRGSSTSPGSLVTVTNSKNKKSKKENEKEKEKEKEKPEPKKNGSIKWGHWTDWSSCSVSCGKGRQIRWRHCVDNCQDAETEMEEKTCQLPACSPGKLFGVIKI